MKERIEDTFCNCGIPLNLDFKLVCGRCNRAVNPQRVSATSSPKKKKQGNPVLRIVGWIALIYIVSALFGGLISMDQDNIPAPGIIAEENYEQNGIEDSFVGTL